MDLHPRVFDNEQITASNQKKMVEVAGVGFAFVVGAHHFSFQTTADSRQYLSERHNSGVLLGI
jgi:hypothetical protein